MIIYADLRWPEKTGIGVVQREMLQRVPSSIEIADLHVEGSIGSPFSPIAISSALARRKVEKGVFWSPGFIPPAHCRIPSIVTVHDLIHLRFYTQAHVTYYNWVLKRLYRKATRIVCVSEYTRREFLEWSGMPGESIVKICNGVSNTFHMIASDTEVSLFPYVFYPGNHRSYKNTDRLLHAYSISALPQNGIHLLFTGPPQRRLQSKAYKLGLSDLVHFVGDVTDDRLVRLYKGALVVAFVSLYEGFGLPIVEAMAAGIPVLTSDTAAMPETAGDAALLVNPYSIDAIADGLNVLAFDHHERVVRIRLGYVRARKFSWDVTAAKLWALIDLVGRSDA